MAEIVVIGSLNMDLVTRTGRIPAAGETLIGTEFHLAPGGKGANQAAAAARLGGQVAMVGRVGQDLFGVRMRADLAALGVDVSCLWEDPRAASGVGVILLEESGENRIVIVPGANDLLSPEDVEAAAGLLLDARAVLLQLEVLTGTVEYAAAAARRAGARVVLNAAPARPLSNALLREVDVLVVNEIEAALLVGQPVSSLDDARAAGATLRARGAGAVVVTLGAQGALLLEGARVLHAPARQVPVVDTTGAGDAFTGALAVRLAAGDDLAQALPYAVAAGTLAVTRLGAQAALPDTQAVAAFLEAGREELAWL